MTDKNINKSKKKQKTEDIWDISIYTDDEIIHNILNMSNPTDRELEMKIWTYIKNYQQQPPTPQNKQWLNFYEQIYERLFTFEKEDFTTEKTEDDNENKEDDEKSSENNQNKKEGLIDNSQTQNTILVKQTDYIKGSLNPILKETISRTLTIDSQYRENKKDYTTQFSLNLTETIRDVVSIKLYSVHIPYTWYTISTDYGSNYILIEGNSPGIINKDQYQIIIPAGNYTQTTLASTINESIQTNLVQTYTDICFGTTAISYNPNNSLMTWTIDIQNIFNETYYSLDFPLTFPATYISPNDTILNRLKTIPSFLGYSNISNNFLSVTSEKNLPPFDLNNQTTSATFVISSTSNTPNNQIIFYQYLGPLIDKNISILNSTQDPNFLQKYSITIPDGLYSVSTLTYTINNLIQKADFLTNSSFGHYNLSDASYSYFQFNLQLNRQKTVNQQYAKLAVLLPNDLSLNIWTSSNSCFRFTSNQPPINEISGNITYSYYPFYINSLNSEFKSLQTNYIIGDSTEIVLTCITEPWNVLENNYTLQIKKSEGAGYILNDYIKEINNSISSNPIFNTTNSYSFIGSDSNFHLRLDLNKTFDQTTYLLDLSGTELVTTEAGITFVDNNNNPISLSTPFDLSINNVFNYTLENKSAFILNTGAKLMKIYVKPGINVGNQNDTTYNIQFTNPTNNNYSSPTAYTNDIHTSINNYQNPLSKFYPLFSSNFTLDGNPRADGKYHGVMTIVINNTLTEKEYSLSFVDPSNSWSTNFDVSSNLTGTDISYVLSNYIISNSSYSEIKGGNPIFNTQIYVSDLSGNNTFQLTPLSDSYFLQTSDIPNPNVYTFTIPNGLYTREQLINLMNILLQSNNVTQYSLVSVITINNEERTNILINTNKTFTSSDYRLVFYDDTQFGKCNFGSTKVGKTTWDTTLGWILGFRENTTYNLANYITTSTTTYNLSNISTIEADTTCSTTLYNYFIITLDDYNQNHVNDGLVTITTTETSIPIPSYANQSNFICNPTTGLYVYTGIVQPSDGIYNNLTQKQIYAITEIMNNNPNMGYLPGNVPASKYSNAPFVRDVLAIVPVKTAGLVNGQTLVNDSGPLQTQNRLYFGPVNINRLNISLMDDRGHVVNLNNSNWSFTLLIDQLYKKSN